MILCERHYGQVVLHDMFIKLTFGGHFQELSMKNTRNFWQFTHDDHRVSKVQSIYFLGY